MYRPSSRTYDKGSGRGFSFIELVVVMAMMATLASISFAGIRGALPLWRLNAATRMIRGDLVDARTRAEKDMREIRFTFTANGYTIEKGNARAASNAWAPSNERGQVSSRDIAGEFPGINFIMAETSTPVTFQPTGTIDPSGGNLRLTVRNDLGKERIIVISMAGRIRISQ
ncbi:MAG: GspH/FimT family pseudopilin [Thermodesulfobacteriota bacterium]